MAPPLEDLRLRMERAAAELDFEEASRLRDRISLLRGRPDTEADIEQDIDTSRLRRQQPGAMGLGTSDQRYTPPPGWKPPPRPDPMTTGNLRPRRRRR